MPSACFYHTTDEDESKGFFEKIAEMKIRVSFRTF